MFPKLNSIGNQIIVQVATISTGRCAGDRWFRVIIRKADDQMACSTTGGMSTVTVLSDKFKIYGRCASTLIRQTGGWALITPPVNNWGLV